MRTSINDRQLMLIGIPLFLTANYFGNQYYQLPLGEVMPRIGLTALLVLCQWQVLRFVWNRLRKCYSGPNQGFKRILLSIFFGGFVGMFIAAFLQLRPEFFSWKFLALNNLAAHFGPMFFFSALVIGAHEVLYSFKEMRRMQKEREGLKKAHLQSQLDSLKSQVNPHFLFNSLNTLLSLISASPATAERFVEELSTVYRYLLQANEKELATLGQELDFTNSYFHLLKTRYGSGIQLNIQIDKALLDYSLPSLSLQLLLENAVKHNVISCSRPLKIDIYTEGLNGRLSEETRLTVRNNLQRKIHEVSSNRMGLNNIMAKLKLLNQSEVIIKESDTEFIVSLPLFKSKIV